MKSNMIYDLTQRVNNTLHLKIGMTDLQDRMLFTACSLVAVRFHSAAWFESQKDKTYSDLHTAISQCLAEHPEHECIPAILEELSSIRIDQKDNDAVNTYIDEICELADLVNADNYSGEDVIGILFSEFTRYKGKSDAGQVFTPDHIAGFMYRLLDCSSDDRVLDATCGSGVLLVKALSQMLQGQDPDRQKHIKQNNIFGIEYMRKVYALACANLLCHKDANANIVQMDASSSEASEWIKSKNITKVLLNPPYERKYKCADIVCNVLDSVPPGTKVAIILPDKKVEKEKKIQKALKRHTLTTIIKLPENVFFGIGVTTSIFVFETGTPQNGRTIVGYNMEDDGFETVKNQGRHDTKNKWPDIEEYWINAIKNNDEPTRQEIDSAQHQSYQMPEKPFEIYREDFVKTAMDYEFFKRGIDAKKFTEQLMYRVLYSSQVYDNENAIVIVIPKDKPKSAF